MTAPAITDPRHGFYRYGRIADLFNAFRSVDWIAWIDSDHGCLTITHTPTMWELDVFQPSGDGKWNIHTSGTLNDDMSGLPGAPMLVHLPANATDVDIVTEIVKLIFQILLVAK